MKKILITSLAATAMVFAVESATAQVYEEGATQQTFRPYQDEMQKIEASELPQEVQQSVERDFSGATISEAYVKEKEGERTYKVVLSTQDGASRELYADAKGNWIDKENKDQE